jgi:hypothetical protein
VVCGKKPARSLWLGMKREQLMFSSQWGLGASPKGFFLRRSSDLLSEFFTNCDEGELSGDEVPEAIYISTSLDPADEVRLAGTS